MKTCKIAITIPENLLKTIDAISKKCNISRSKIISEGAKHVAKKFARKKIIDSYNKTFSDKQTNKEQIDLANSFLNLNTLDQDEY